MNEVEIEEGKNPYSIYTTAGLSYKAMRIELGKKKVSVRISDEEGIESVEDSDHIISKAAGKRSKKLPKPKIKQIDDASQKSVNEVIENNSSSVEDGNVRTTRSRARQSNQRNEVIENNSSNEEVGNVRTTRSRARQNNQRNTSDCGRNNEINTGAQPITTRRGRRTQNPRNNVLVLNAEPIVIPDSPPMSPMVSESVPPEPRIPLAVQDDLIVLSDDSDVEVNKPESKGLELSLTEDDNYEVPVRVWWKFGNIDKFNIRKFQKLTSIFQHYSQQENVPEENILLMLKNVKIQQNDTPDSLGLVPGMIIEGGVCGNCSSSTTAISSSKVAEPAPHKDDIELRIQQKGQKVPLKLTVNKTQKMKVLMLKCAEQLELPIEKLKLYFDGEAVSAEDTPEDLDLEGGECMDLHVL